MTHLTYTSHRDALAAGRFLRVVNYHSTPSSSRGELRAELADFARRFQPVGLTDLDAFYDTGAWPEDRAGFLPVFYEGYANNASVAAEVCDELGLVGWFLVVTGFVDCAPREQELFARSHYIGLAEEDLSADRISMTWDQVGEVAQRHVVTPHTAWHSAVSEVSTDEDLEREVVASKRAMDAATGQSSPAFAWMLGSPWGQSPRHDEAVRAAGYRYLVSNSMLHRIA